ncbi:non-receptor tyrosine-protein kinase TYK2 [Aix galericulata]|nr:non-receptor tyrosine-protein kinase TYK2 [Aix galericulata]
MEQFQKEKEELDKGCRECKRKLAECQRKLKELEVAEAEGGRAEVARLQAEAQQLRNEERGWESKLEELRKKEKNMPWNVDTLSKDGFSKSVFNVKPEEEEETEEQKEKKHKSFVERYEKQIKHFGEPPGPWGVSTTIYDSRGGWGGGGFPPTVTFWVISPPLNPSSILAGLPAGG